jgi:hypothetical protein
MASVYFEYSTTSGGPYIQTTPVSVTSNTQINNLISNLIPNTTYYYRSVITNIYGTTTSPELSFTTSSVPVNPLVVTVSVNSEKTIIGGPVTYTANISGGVQPQTILWSDGVTTSTNIRTFTAIGNYNLSVTVSDELNNMTVIAPVVSVIDPIKIPILEVASKQDFDRLRLYKYNY